jgi:hypothetical protein
MWGHIAAAAVLLVRTDVVIQFLQNLVIQIASMMGSIAPALRNQFNKLQTWEATRQPLQPKSAPLKLT